MFYVYDKNMHVTNARHSVEEENWRKKREREQRKESAEVEEDDSFWTLETWVR